MPPPDAVEQQLKNLESHLAQENPVLLSTVQSFRALDKVAHAMGLLAPGPVLRDPDSLVAPYLGAGDLLGGQVHLHQPLSWL
jgi:hypothetical protein